MTTLKGIIGAAVFTTAAFTTQQSLAAVPSLSEVGGHYGKYVVTAELATSTSTAVNPNAVLNATLPYGTNAAYYSYFTALTVNAEFNLQFTAQSIEFFYTWLGKYYAYQNYQYPTYGDNLQSFYTSYGEDQADDYVSSASPALNYYEASADYYEGLIFP